METEDPFPIKGDKCLLKEQEESDLKEKACDAPAEVADGSAVLEKNLVTEEMKKEEHELQEKALAEERKLAEEQDELWKQMSEEDRSQRYQRLKFLLSKSNMYTQYLINRMKQQAEEDEKKRERQAKKLKKKEEKLKELSQEQDTDSASQSSQASDVSTRRTRKRKSEAANFDSPKLTKTPGKRSRKNPKEENTSSQKTDDKENAQSENYAERTATDEKTEVKELTKVETGAEEELDDDKDNLDPLPGRVINGEPVSDGQPRLLTGGVLRKYQMDGFSWLKVLYENGVNAILADEMGLGKTIQCIAELAHLVDMGVTGPFLIIGPLSTIPNWYNEFERFSPRVPVVLYHGNKEERRALRAKFRKKTTIRKDVEAQPVVITSYEIAMNDREQLMHYEWKYLVVDEGHRLKNTHCRLIRELRMYRSTYRLLLTGTPLQNNLAELWSLLNFILPEIFDDLGSFEAWFDVTRIEGDAANERIIAEEKKDNIISMLHQILTPFMLRRLKSDVELVIPPKREVLVMAPLTNMQKEYYSSIVDKSIMKKMQEKHDPSKEKVELDAKGRPKRRSTTNKVNYSLMVEDKRDASPKKNKKAEYEEDLESWISSVIDTQEERNKTQKAEVKTKTAEINIRMQNTMMQLRKCCSHPYLLEHPIDQESGHLVGDESIVTHSGKMLLLDRMLPELKKKGHKVLIFSQMTRMLNILESYCDLRDYEFCRLDGSRSVQDRGEQIKAFNEDSNIFLFLVSTRAGGLGVNLTAADTVIIYDSDWNPQSDLQAQDRCHRIGQTRPVMVYRFVTGNTIDQKIVERAAAKRKLEKMIIHKGKFKSGMSEFSTSLKPINAQELMDLLKSRDHEAVVNDSQKNVISDKDLASLLDRSDLHKKMEELKAEKGEGKTKTPARRVKKKSKEKEPMMEGKSFKVLDTDDGCYTNECQTELSESERSSALDIIVKQEV